MTLASCMLSDCPNDVRARGVCAKHYKVWQRHGNAAHVALPKAEEKSSGKSWRRYGTEGKWTADLTEADRLAVLGE